MSWVKGAFRIIFQGLVTAFVPVWSVHDVSNLSFWDSYSLCSGFTLAVAMLLDSNSEATQQPAEQRNSR